jgi:ATP-dependent helicase HepA
VLTKLAGKAKSRLREEETQAVARMRLSLAHQGVKEEQIEAQVEAEKAHYDALEGALAGLSVKLDSVSGFVINR